MCKQHIRVLRDTYLGQVLIFEEKGLEGGAKGISISLGALQCEFLGWKILLAVIQMYYLCAIISWFKFRCTIEE